MACNLFEQAMTSQHNLHSGVFSNEKSCKSENAKIGLMYF